MERREAEEQVPAKIKTFRFLVGDKDSDDLGKWRKLVCWSVAEIEAKLGRRTCMAIRFRYKMAKSGLTSRFCFVIFLSKCEQPCHSYHVMSLLLGIVLLEVIAFFRTLFVIRN